MRTVKCISPILAIAWVCLGMATAQDTLQRRTDGLWYLADAEQPYTGMTERKHFDGTRINEISYRNGKQHGPTIDWWPEGKKSFEEH